MRRIVLFLTVVLLVSGGAVRADFLAPEEEPEEVEIFGAGGPMQAGRLEISPMMSLRFSGSALVYRAGVTMAYALTRTHQLGGTFVMGNRAWDRANRREVVVGTPGDTHRVTGRILSVDQGFGSSLTGFYRYNIPYQIEKRTYPFVEVFGGRDFGWGDVSEVGGGAGVRKFISSRTAMTSQYAFTVLFADGQHVTRHIVTAGVSMFFR
jgi:hypothetical protein